MLGIPAASTSSQSTAPRLGRSPSAPYLATCVATGSGRFATGTVHERPAWRAMRQRPSSAAANASTSSPNWHGTFVMNPNVSRAALHTKPASKRLMLSPTKIITVAGCFAARM